MRRRRYSPTPTAFVGALRAFLDLGPLDYAPVADVCREAWQHLYAAILELHPEEWGPDFEGGHMLPSSRTDGPFTRMNAERARLVLFGQERRP